MLAYSEKGGVGKSTTSGVLAYALSQEHKVLAVDMDGQGNFTQLLTDSDDIFEFKGTTIYDAIINENASDYILKINPNLHILCGDEHVTTLAGHFYINVGRNYVYTLKNILDKVSADYDYIIIDNPPALGELSVISLTASDYVVIMFETSMFCYNSLKSYLKTIHKVQEKSNENLKIAGILRTMIDKRRNDNKYFSDLVKEEFSNYCLETIIQRSAVVGRLPALGILNNPEKNQVMKIYKPFIKEVMKNVKR